MRAETCFIAVTVLGVAISGGMVFMAALGILGVFLERRRRRWQPAYRGHRVECSWCGWVMRGGFEPASHGCCPECLQEQLQKITTEDEPR